MRKSYTIDHLLEYNVDSDVTTVTLFESELGFVVDGSAKVPFSADANFTVDMRTKLTPHITEMLVFGDNTVQRLPAMQGETIITVMRPNLEDLSNSVDIRMLVASDDGLKIDVPNAFVEPKKPTFFWG
jgi:hypothetical protein